jgi:hypothetical protein
MIISLIISCLNECWLNTNVIVEARHAIGKHKVKNVKFLILTVDKSMPLNKTKTALLSSILVITQTLLSTYSFILSQSQILQTLSLNFKSNLQATIITNGKPNIFSKQNSESMHRFRWPRWSHRFTHSLGFSPFYRRRRWPGSFHFRQLTSIRHRYFIIIIINQLINN